MSPDISVVVPSYNSRATIEACLEALARQRFDGRYEIVLVDSSADGTATLIAERFPDVRLVTSATRLFPGDARNAGVAASRGPIVAFTDADCVASPDWLERITRAHEAGHALVCGSLKPPTTGFAGRAYHLAAFSQWLDDGTPRPTRQIAAGCFSASRKALDECGPFRERTLGSDSGFSWNAARRGYTALFEPSISVVHLAGDRPLRSLLARRFANGRAFAALRVQDQRLAPARTLAYGALAPFLPALLFARVIRRVLAARRDRTALLLLAPLVLVFLAAWSLGESVGYLGSVAVARTPELDATHG